MKFRTLRQGMANLVYFDCYVSSAKLFCQNSRRQLHFQQRFQEYVWLKVVFEKLFILHCAALTVSVHGGSKLMVISEANYGRDKFPTFSEPLKWAALLSAYVSK